MPWTLSTSFFFHVLTVFFFTFEVALLINSTVILGSIWVDPGDQAQLETSIAQSPEGVGYPRRHKMNEM